MPNANILNLGVVLGVYALGDYFHGSGLLRLLVFGVTLANLPRTPHMTRQGARMMAFHAEFSFLVRSFFFVLLGVVAQFVSRQYIVPILGILAALLLARYLAMQGSRWVVRDVPANRPNCCFWMLPRGLVTAVLARPLSKLAVKLSAFCPRWRSRWCWPTLHRLERVQCRVDAAAMVEADSTGAGRRQFPSSRRHRPRPQPLQPEMARAWRRYNDASAKVHYGGTRSQESRLSFRVLSGLCVEIDLVSQITWS